MHGGGGTDLVKRNKHRRGKGNHTLLCRASIFTDLEIKVIVGRYPEDYIEFLLI